MIDIFHVTIIINAGVAGGMDERIQLFDTIISQQVIYHEVTDDILTDFHPWLKSNYFHADPKSLAAAKIYSENTTSPILFGTMVTGEQFIEDEKRNEIKLSYAPLSVDMETVSVAHVCYVNGIPFKNCESASEISEIVLGIIGELD